MLVKYCNQLFLLVVTSSDGHKPVLSGLEIQFLRQKYELAIFNQINKWFTFHLVGDFLAVVTDTIFSPALSKNSGHASVHNIIN